jgi:hypothetical protein
MVTPLPESISNPDQEVRRKLLSLQTLVTFQASSEVSKIRFEDYEILDVLGEREEAIAVQLKELLSSVTEAVREAIESEGELSVEINGALELKASAGIQYLFFNVGAGASKTNTMKVTLKTKVTPKDATS